MGPLYRTLSSEKRKEVRNTLSEFPVREMFIYDEAISKLPDDDQLQGARAARELKKAAEENDIKSVGELLQAHGRKMTSGALQVAKEKANEAGSELSEARIYRFLQDALWEQVALHITHAEKFRSRGL